MFFDDCININMKINSCLYLCFLIIVFSLYGAFIPFNANIIKTIIFSFIPSLLPSLILVNIFIDIGGLDTVYNLAKNNKLGHLIYTLILIFFSMILGMPAMQILIDNQYQKKIINNGNKQKFISSIGCISFPFLSMLFMINEHPLQVQLYVFFTYFFINIFALYVSGFRINIQNITEKEPSLGIINQSFIKSIKSISIISCSVILFSLPSFLFEYFNIPYRYYFAELIEFSYPLSQLSKSSEAIDIASVLFFINFPSLSVLLQSKLIHRELNIKKYIKKRLCIAIISFILIYILIS